MQFLEFLMFILHAVKIVFNFTQEFDQGEHFHPSVSSNIRSAFNSFGVHFLMDYREKKYD
jgi:hypothetical protein